jgi:carbonic anhydrase
MHSYVRANDQRHPALSAADVITLLHMVFRYDVSASQVTFLVALPLSIGIAVASGAPVVAGLIAAIGGSPVNSSSTA